MSDQITVTSVRRQCRHIFPDGHRCGSPCLRSEEFCYYHHTTRKPAPRRPSFDIAIPDNHATVQLALGEVLSRIASEQIMERWELEKEERKAELKQTPAPAPHASPDLSPDLNPLV